MSLEGGCFCGALRYRVSGQPRRVTHCHCLHCRRTCGAPFVTWVEYPADRFVFIAGTPGTCATRPQVTREFCRDCGTQLTFRDADEPGAVDVTVASFDSPEGFEPEDHVWSDRMLPWLRFDDGLPQYPRSRYE